MHQQARIFVEDAVARLGPSFPSVVELGSRDLNGGVRDLFTTPRYVGLDVAAGQGVDVVFEPADPSTWADVEPASAVVCCEVLEHVEEWPSVLRMAHDLLEEGGWLILTAAGPGRKAHSGITGRRQLEPGEHYANVEPTDLAFHLGRAGFEVAEVGFVPYDVQALARR